MTEGQPAREGAMPPAPAAASNANPSAFDWLEWDALTRRARAGHRWLDRPAVASMVAWLLFVGLAAVVIGARGVIVKLTVHDTYFVFDGIWRIFSGQLPYRDFHSPIGAAYYLPFAVLRHLEPYSLSVLLHANLLVAAAFLLLATIALRDRYAPMLYLLATLGMVSVAISPRATDHGVRIYSLLAPYNRWSEAATMLIALVVLTTRRVDRAAQGGRTAHEWRGVDAQAAIAVALALLFVLHVKISYFPIGLGLVGVGLVARRFSWRSGFAAGGLLAVLDLLVEAAFRVHAPYFADLGLAARAASTSGYAAGSMFRSVDTGLQMVVQFFVAAGALLGLASWRGDLRRWLAEQWLTLAMVLAALLLAFLGNTQNHWQTEIPMMCSILVAVAEQARRQWVPSRGPSLRGVAFAVIVLVASRSIPATELASVLAFTAESRSRAVCPLPGWIGTPAERLLFPRQALVRPGDQPPSSCDQVAVDLANVDIPMGPAELEYTPDARNEAARLTAARALLGTKLRPDEAIFALAFANPYPAFTGTRPPKGVELWWHYGRSYSREARPDPGPIFDSTDKVLVSRFDPFPESHGGDLLRVYGDTLVRDFRPVAQNRLWQLWERRVPRR